MKKKICKRCNIEKELVEFHKHKEMADGHLNYCKVCQNARNRQYRRDNADKVNSQRKAYRDDPDNKAKITAAKKRCEEAKKEQYKAQKAEYYQRNKERIKAKSVKWRSQNKEYRNSRYANEPLYKIMVKMRASFSEIIRKKHIPKTGKTRDIIGCSWDEFKQHLENNPYNFKVGDSEVDIDHIVPVCNAQTEVELLKLNHYTNLQLLPSFYNKYVKRNNDFDRENFENWLAEAI